MHLINRIKKEHKQLGKMLDIIMRENTSEEPDLKEIIRRLGEFKQFLMKHAEFEEVEFYPLILKIMNTNGEDTSDAQNFIADMGKISNLVSSIIGRYPDEDSVADKRKDFNKDLGTIYSLVSMRVKTEEDGMVAYWRRNKELI